MNIYEEDQHDETPIEITLEQLQELRDECKSLINVADAAQRLKENQDFILVMQETYFEKEPKRLGSLIASGRMPESAMEGAIADLKSIGNCITFLNDLVQKGEIARGEIAAADEAYNESIAETA